MLLRAGACPCAGGSPLMRLLIPCADEEPFLIFANRYYLRKLNLDGSNYTLLKQVRSRRGAPARGVGVCSWGLERVRHTQNLPAQESGLLASRTDSGPCINNGSCCEYTQGPV